MIYVKRVSDTSLAGFETPGQALDHIEGQGWNPSLVEAWQTDGQLVPIGFEDLNRMAGRPWVQAERVEFEARELLGGVDAWFRDNRGWRIEVEEMSVSTGGLPQPSSIVRRWFGNPMARVKIVARTDDHLTGEPPRLTAERIRIAIRGVEAAGGPAGWHVLTSDVGRAVVRTGIRGRAIRRHEVVLSKARIEFSYDLPSGGPSEVAP